MKLPTSLESKEKNELSRFVFLKKQQLQGPLESRNEKRAILDAMGQGYSLTSLSAGSAGIDVPELADLVYEKSLGTARFMKSIRARQQNGLVFVKVIMKPYPNMRLEPYVKAILREFYHYFQFISLAYSLTRCNR